MDINNFKELERQEIAELGKPPETIRQKIAHNMGLFRFIGDLIELYLPHAGKSIIGMTKGESKINPAKYPNQDSNI
jgi:hypothetical protein